MATVGHLDLGAAKVVDESDNHIGYAYTVATPTGQLQRWLLYRNPNNSFKVQPPPEGMAGWSLSDWQANVPSLWKEGLERLNEKQAFYVRAKADVYRYGESYGGVLWTRIPQASKLPLPSYPEGSDAPYQLDPLGKAIDVMQNAVRGHAYTRNGLSDDASVEYWVLPTSYQPAGARSAVGISPGSKAASSLDHFIDIANESFLPGSAFVITGCVNFFGATPPAIL